MIIKNKHNRALRTIEEWKTGFLEVDKRTHWCEGYSAHSLGLFFTTGKGLDWLRDLEKTILGEVIEHTAAEIEHASKLDSFRGAQRMQDLAIWGKTVDGKTCFIGIEAKVLEPFGDLSIYDSFLAGIEEREERNPRSKKAERVYQVVNFLFGGRTPDDEAIKHLRYQLAHYFKASIMEAPSIEESSKPLNSTRSVADIVILPVLVFRTAHYKQNTKLAENNYNDFIDFVKTLGYTKERIGDRDVYHAIIDGRDIYTVYEFIDL